MGTLDIILLALFIPGLVRGLTHGFTEQIAALVAILLGGNLALTFSDKLGIWLEQYIHASHTILYIISFTAIIVITVLSVKLLSNLITKLMNALTLKWLNILLGVLFSIAVTSVVLGLLVMLIESLMATFGFKEGLDYFAQSPVRGFLRSVLDYVFPLVKDLFQIG